MNYVFDDAKNKIEGMSREQIIAAIAEATGHTPQDIDDAFITQLLEQNGNKSIKLWVGKQAEYNLIAEPDENTLYCITDPQETNEMQEQINRLQSEINNLIVPDMGNVRGWTIESQYEQADNVSINQVTGKKDFRKDFTLPDGAIVIEVSYIATKVVPSPVWLTDGAYWGDLAAPYEETHYVIVPLDTDYTDVWIKITYAYPSNGDLAELYDIRVGYDGTEYETAGDAVREQIVSVRKNMSDYVDEWLDDHPEATTTVQDGSITPVKFSDSAKANVKYSSVIGKTLNEIFSVYDTVILDTNIEIQNGCDYPVKFVGNKTITFADGITFNDSLYINGCKIYNQSSAIVNVGEIYLDNCELSGSIRFVQSRNIKNSIIKNCYMHDLGISAFYFIDYSFENITIEHNVVKKFRGTLFNIGTTQANVDLTTRKMVVFKNNYIDGVEEVNIVNQGYYTPLLVENNVVYFVDNVIKNLTDNYSSGNPTYSAYLSSNIVEFTGNHIENVHSAGTLYNTFLKSKATGFKHFANNYFKDNYKVSLFSSEDTSKWIVENCIFDASEFLPCSTRDLMYESVFRNCDFISGTNLKLFTNSSNLVFDNCNFVCTTCSSNGGAYGAENTNNPSKFFNCTFDCVNYDSSVIQNRLFQNKLINSRVNTYANLLNPESENSYIRKVIVGNTASMKHKSLTCNTLVSSYLDKAVPCIVKAYSRYSNIVDFVKITYDSQNDIYLYNGAQTQYSGEHIDFSPSQAKPYLREKAAYSGLDKTIDIISL